MAKRLYFKDYYYLQGNNVHIHGVGSLKVPTGNTAQRPDVMEGALRFNTDSSSWELGTDDQIISLNTNNDGSSSFYPIDGGELRGNLLLKADSDDRILNAHGTSTRLSYTFSGDMDTGFYRSAENTIDVVVGGEYNTSVPLLRLSRKGTSTGDLDQQLEINGDLIVQGTMTSVNSTDLEIEDNTITLNKNGTNTGNSGIEIEANASVAARLHYDFSKLRWSTAGRLIGDMPVPVLDGDLSNKQYIDSEIIRTTGPDSDLQQDINSKEGALGFTPEDSANKSQNNGYASLDGGGKVPTSELPYSAFGGIDYKGTWDAVTNTPTLSNGTGIRGEYYKVNNASSAASNTTLDGENDWSVGDILLFNGTYWEKFDQTNKVTSVRGTANAVPKLGDVVLSHEDLGATVYGSDFLTSANASEGRQKLGLGTSSTYDVGTLQNQIPLRGVNGNISGNLTGNASSATQLQTTRTFSFTGDATGSGTFNGTSNLSIALVVQDDSHNHIISNIDGLQNALDGKDNYGSWNLRTDGVSRDNIVSGEAVNFVGGSNVNLSYSATNNTITINSTDTNTNTTYDAGTGISLSGTTFSLSDERYTTAEKSKLAGIESNATGDQTSTEIKTAYELNANTNAYTDSEKTKLAGIESGATADQTKADIDALNIDADTLDGQHGSYYLNYNNLNNTPTYDNYNGWALNTDGVNRGSITSGETVRFNGGSNVSLSYSATNNTITINSTDTNTNTTYSAGTGISLSGTTFSLSDETYTTAEKSKLAGIESGATADQTKADIDALNIDAGQLDGINSTSFLRSDVEDYFTHANMGLGTGMRVGVNTDAAVSHTGLVLQSHTNPASGSRLLTVKSQGHSPRFVVEHDGFIKSSNSDIYVSIAADGSGGNRVYHENYHPTADALSSNIQLSLSGDVTGSVTTDLSGNTDIVTEVANDSHTHEWSNVTSKPVGSKGEVYYFAEDGSAVEASKILHQLRIVDNSQQLIEEQQSVTSFQDVFNNWYRFSHGSTDTYPSDGSETNAWTYNSTTDTIECTINSATHIGFVSDKEYNTYVHEATVTSSGTDNDMLGVVVAFDFDENDLVTNNAFGSDPATYSWDINTTDAQIPNEHTLTLVRMRSTQAHIQVGATGIQYGIVYNFNKADEKIIANGDALIDTVTGAFSGVESKVRIERNGDIIEVWTTEWSDSTSYDGTLKGKITIDLTSDPDLEKFRGKKAYGYSALSQPSATYKNITFANPEGKIYDVSTGTSWYYDGTQWVQESTNVQSEIGIGRLIQNPEYQDIYYVEDENTVTKIYEYSNSGNYYTKTEIDNIASSSRWSTEQVIASGSSQVYNLSNIFGTYLTDARDIIFDIKVLDNISGSATNGMWVDATAVSTYGVNTTTNEFTLINEYSTSLTFYIKALI